MPDFAKDTAKKANMKERTVRRYDFVGKAERDAFVIVAGLLWSRPRG